MRLHDRLALNKIEKKAVLGTNFYNFETLSAVLIAARNTNSDIVLQLSERSIRYLGLTVAKKLARSAAQQFGVTAWLHLDHGRDMNLIKQCIAAGFDSVMVDASEYSFEKNVSITREIVKYATSYHINVEAELGYISKLGQDQKMIHTQPDEAKRFVAATGVNALAIAVGSAHGFYKETPELQIPLIKEIDAATPAALVLHGGSGIPDQQLQQAIRNGITKVNLATAIKNAFMKNLKQEFFITDTIDLREVFPKASNAVSKLVEDKMRIINFTKVLDG